MVVASPSALERSGLLTRITATEGPTRCVDQKSRSGVERRANAGHNRGDELPADDTQLSSVG